MTNERSFHGAPSLSWLPVHGAWFQSAPTVLPFHVGKVLSLPNASCRRRIERWQEGISELFTDLSPEALEPETFTGKIETIYRGNLSVSHIAAGAQRVHREGTKSRGSALDRFYLNVQLEGHGYVRDSRGETRLSVGDCVLIDPNRSYVLDFHSPFRQLCVQIDQWWLREKFGLPPEKALGLPISLGRGGGPILWAALEAVINSPESEGVCTAEFVELFGDVITRMMRMAGNDSFHAMSGLAETAFYERLCQFVAGNFRDEAISAATAAKKLGCSVRYVHKICCNRGTTFGRLVMNARLSAAARMLPKLAAGDRISSVAYDCGFSDLSHFGRAFRQKYGESPGAYRAARS